MAKNDSLRTYCLREAKQRAERGNACFIQEATSDQPGGNVTRICAPLFNKAFRLIYILTILAGFELQAAIAKSMITEKKELLFLNSRRWLGESGLHTGNPS